MDGVFLERGLKQAWHVVPFCFSAHFLEQGELRSAPPPQAEPEFVPR
jgi:hypothetical protein